MQPYYERDGITIYHADCRAVLPMLGAVDAVVTDPPYGVNHGTDYTRFTGGKLAPRYQYAAIAGDDEPFDPSPLVSRAANVVLFGANAYSDRLPCGSWLVWDKRPPGGYKSVMSDAEVAWWSRGHGVYLWAHAWDGFNRASERQTAYHPTQKPAALMTWVLDKCTRPGDLIADPYMGSGPTLLAAYRLGRRAIGIEIEERYCEIAARRLSQGVLPLEIKYGP